MEGLLHLAFCLMLVATDPLIAHSTPEASQQPAPHCQGHHIPDISDTHFNLTRVAEETTSLTLTTASGSRGTLFTYSSITAPSNCSDTATGFQFCYQIFRGSLGTRQAAFHFLSLARDDLQFTVTKRITIATTPTENICTDLQGTSIYVCCDKITLRPAQRFRIQDYTHAIVVASKDVDLLAFKNSPLQHPLQQFKARVAGTSGPLVQDTFTLDTSHIWKQHSILMSRLLIESADQEEENTSHAEGVTTITAEDTHTTQHSVEYPDTTSPAGLTRSTCTLITSIIAGAGVVLAISLTIVFLVALAKMRSKKLKRYWNMKMDINDAYGLSISDIAYYPSLRPRPARSTDEDYGYIDPREVGMRYITHQKPGGADSTEQLEDYGYIDPREVGMRYITHQKPGGADSTEKQEITCDYIEPIKVCNVHRV